MIISRNANTEDAACRIAFYVVVISAQPSSILPSVLFEMAVQRKRNKTLKITAKEIDSNGLSANGLKPVQALLFPKIPEQMDAWSLGYDFIALWRCWLGSS